MNPELKKITGLKPFTVVTRKRSDDTLFNMHRRIESPNLRDARTSGRAMAELFDEYYVTTMAGHVLV